MNKFIKKTALILGLAFSLCGCDLISVTSVDMESSVESVEKTSEEAVENISEDESVYSTESKSESTEAESTEVSTEALEDSTKASEKTQNSTEQSTKQEGENAVQETTEITEKTLTETANALYIKGADLYFKFFCGTPYEIDFDTTPDWEYFLVTDPEISSIDDVIKDYCEVFETADELISSEKFMEQGGKVYFRDGGRGKKLTYAGTSLEFVGGDETFGEFNAVSKYMDTDTGEHIETKSHTFKIVMTENGWRISEFTLPM